MAWEVLDRLRPEDRERLLAEMASRGYTHVPLSTRSAQHAAEIERAGLHAVVMIGWEQYRGPWWRRLLARVRVWWRNRGC